MARRCLICQVPGRLWFRLLVLVAALSVPFLLVALVRGGTSGRPRVQLIQDMGVQPVLKTQAATPIFADRRASRTPVEGTIAHAPGAVHDDPLFYRGVEVVSGHEQWTTNFPTQVTVDDSSRRRGRERFQIYCSVCHGPEGLGNGLAAERAKQLAKNFVPPVSLRGAQVKAQPNGYLFSVITHGSRTMPGYAEQISVADRWAIIAYVRDLQTR